MDLGHYQPPDLTTCKICGQRWKRGDRMLLTATLVTEERIDIDLAHEECFLPADQPESMLKPSLDDTPTGTGQPTFKRGTVPPADQPESARGEE